MKANLEDRTLTSFDELKQLCNEGTLIQFINSECEWQTMEKGKWIDSPFDAYRIKPEELVNTAPINAENVNMQERIDFANMEPISVEEAIAIFKTSLTRMYFSPNKTRWYKVDEKHIFNKHVYYCKVKQKSVPESPKLDIELLDKIALALITASANPEVQSEHLIKEYGRRIYKYAKAIFSARNDFLDLPPEQEIKS